jgi:hypothetical protein
MCGKYKTVRKQAQAEMLSHKRLKADPRHVKSPGSADVLKATFINRSAEPRREGHAPGEWIFMLPHSDRMDVVKRERSTWGWASRSRVAQRYRLGSARSTPSSASTLMFVLSLLLCRGALLLTAIRIKAGMIINKSPTKHAFLTALESEYSSLI